DSESGSVYDELQRCVGGHAVPASDAQSPAPANLVENTEARHARRLARFRHGRLEAGADAERGRRSDLLLDDYAGSGEESGDGKTVTGDRRSASVNRRSASVEGRL